MQFYSKFAIPIVDCKRIDSKFIKASKRKYSCFKFDIPLKYSWIFRMSGNQDIAWGNMTILQWNNRGTLAKQKVNDDSNPTSNSKPAFNQVRDKGIYGKNVKINSSIKPNSNIKLSTNSRIVHNTNNLVPSIKSISNTNTSKTNINKKTNKTSNSNSIPLSYTQNPDSLSTLYPNFTRGPTLNPPSPFITGNATIKKSYPLSTTFPSSIPLTCPISIPASNLSSTNNKPTAVPKSPVVITPSTTSFCDPIFPPIVNLTQISHPF